MKSFCRRVQCLPPFPRKIMQLRTGFTGRCFVSGPFSSAKDTVNLKPVKLLFLSCVRGETYPTNFLTLDEDIERNLVQLFWMEL